MAEAYAEPLPHPVPPIMIGGAGGKWTLPVVARHADWWNDVARPIPDLQRKLASLRRHCLEAGRDFDRIRKTWSVKVFIDRSHSVAIQRHDSWSSRGQLAIAGDPSAVRDRFSELAEQGIDLCILAFPRFQELDDLRLFMDEVVPAFG